MRECERCGIEVPVIDLHTAVDGGDVCPDCCDICDNDNSEETNMHQDYRLRGPIASSAQWWAAGVTATTDPESSPTGNRSLTLHTSGMARHTLTGTVAELRAVADAIAAVVNALEGEGGDPILTEEAAALSPENPEAA